MRRNLYRTARILGDLKAARKGPAALGRRLARRMIYRRTSLLAALVSRLLGVSR